MNATSWARVRAAAVVLVATLSALVASYKMLLLAFIKYWEWQHDGRRMKFIFWAQERALPLAILVCALVFILATRYFQRQYPISERFKWSFWKWMFCCGLAGLLVPAVLILHWKLLGSGFGQLEAILWPSSILLMGLEGPTPRSAYDIGQFYAIVIAVNMVLYCAIGLFMWLLLRLAFRRTDVSDSC